MRLTDRAARTRYPELMAALPSVAERPEPHDVGAWLDALAARLAQPRRAAPARRDPDEAVVLPAPTREEIERMEAIDRCVDALQDLPLSPARIALLRERIDAAIELALARHADLAPLLRSGHPGS
jgi:hypothetical protein